MRYQVTVCLRMEWNIEDRISFIKKINRFCYDMAETAVARGAKKTIIENGNSLLLLHISKRDKTMHGNSYWLIECVQWFLENLSLEYLEPPPWRPMVKNIDTTFIGDRQQSTPPPKSPHTHWSFSELNEEYFNISCPLLFLFQTCSIFLSFHPSRSPLFLFIP